jgi:putative transposon-encoded protein
MEEIKVADLVFKAQADIVKVVRKCTPTSGAIYLHKDYIGRRFRVILIPLDEQPKVNDEVAKTEEKIKEDLGQLKQE